MLVSAAGETLSLNLKTGAQLWHDEFKGYGQGGDVHDLERDDEVPLRGELQEIDSPGRACDAEAFDFFSVERDMKGI